MTVTELRRSASGGFEDTPVVFNFSGPEHSSAQGVVELYLKVNHVRKEIPGGNKVVHQMLSATWQPFTLEGEWDDKWGNRRVPSLSMIRSGSYAMSMYQAFADMVRRMPTIRLELDALSVVGVLTDLRIKYQMQGKIGWAVTMSPEDNENIPVQAPRRVPSQPIARWLQDARDQGDALNTAVSDASIVEMKTERVADVTSALLEVNDALDRLDAFGLQDFDFESDVFNKLLLLATTFRRIRQSAVNLADRIKEVTSLDDVAFDDAVFRMQHAEWIAGSHVSALQMVGIARQAERDMRKRAGRRPRAIYRPRRGESLERISMRFYRTADSWRIIYDANDLDSLALTGDEELIIPERRI